MAKNNKNKKSKKGKKRSGKAKRYRTPVLGGAKMLGKLKYSQGFSLTPSGGSTAVKAFSCNGVYAPAISGGHQPRGFDQWMPLFNHYVVIGAKITLRVAGTQGMEDMLFGISTRATSSTNTNIYDYTEGRYNKTWTLAGTNNNPSKTITYKVDPNKFLVRSKPLSDPQLKGDVNNNPLEQCYFHCFCAAMDPSIQTPGTMTCHVDIQYTVLFIEPKLPTQS